MKKKMFAALTASLMLCGMLTAPVSAAETYKKGDVNMDGVIDIADSQLVIKAYCYALAGKVSDLSPEQLELGAINGKATVISGTEQTIPISVTDSQVLLIYATMKTAHIEVPDSIEEFVTKLHNGDYK